MNNGANIPACRVTAVVVLTLALGACVSMQQAACKAGEQFAVHDTLYFGTDIPDGGVVTPGDWSMFLATEVTPKFPQGLTVSEASGQWRGEDGAIVQETSYVLQLVHPDNISSEQSVSAFVSAYKKQFRQEAVLRIRTDACVTL